CADNNVRVWNLTRLPHITSKPYYNNPHTTCVRWECMEKDGWLCGEDSQKLLWVPRGKRRLVSATDPGRVIFGSDDRDDLEFTVVDVQDYLRLPSMPRGAEFPNVRRDIKYVK